MYTDNQSLAVTSQAVLVYIEYNRRSDAYLSALSQLRAKNLKL